VGILGFSILLLIAGNETTTNLIGNMINVLVERPTLWQQLRDDRSLVETMIEETLRYESPVQQLNRQTTRDVEVSGVKIPARALIRVCYGAANRDPKEFPDPDEFRLDRDLRSHVGFGSGHSLLPWRSAGARRSQDHAQRPPRSLLGN